MNKLAKEQIKPKVYLSRQIIVSILTISLTTFYVVKSLSTPDGWFEWSFILGLPLFVLWAGFYYVCIKHNLKHED
jgi:general stress protein CsbA